MIFEQAIREDLKAAIEAVQPNAKVFSYWKQPATQEILARDFLADNESGVNAWVIFFRAARPHEPTNPAEVQGWVLEYGVWHFLEYEDSPQHANTLIANAMRGAKACNTCQFSIRRVNNLGVSIDLIERVALNDRTVSVAQGTISIQTWRTGDEEE